MYTVECTLYTLENMVRGKIGEITDNTCHHPGTAVKWRLSNYASVPGCPYFVTGCPWLSLVVPVLTLAVPVLSLGHLFCPTVIVIVGQDEYIAGHCSLSLTMVEKGA